MLQSRSSSILDTLANNTGKEKGFNSTVAKTPVHAEFTQAERACAQSVTLGRCFPLRH